MVSGGRFKSSPISLGLGTGNKQQFVGVFLLLKTPL
jgi:hypothetical protein